MLNLIRMNIYHLMHMKSAKVVVAIMIAMMVLVVCLDKEDTDIEAVQGDTTASFGLTMTMVEDDGYQESFEDEGEDMAFGIYSKEPKPVNGKKAPFLGYFYADLCSGLILVFLTIIIVLFVGSENSTGFIKNIGGQTTHRSSIYLSKCPAILLCIILYMFMYGACEWLAMKAVYGKDIIFGVKQIGEYAPLIGIQILLYLAFLSGVCMLTSVTRSNVLGITAGLLTAMGLGNYLDIVFKKILDIDNAPKYFVTNNIKQLSFGAENETIHLAILVAVSFTLVYLLVGNLCFVKRDVV